MTARTPLLLLIAAAGLTTTLGPAASAPDLDPDATVVQAEPPLDVNAEGAATPAPPAVALAADASPAVADPAVPAEDEAAAAEIIRRFSIRHTALPPRERRALAHTIVREARLHDLDPDLVMAVIEVESAGYHLAVSHVGAMGLMQLLPTTGAEVAGKLGIDWHGDDTLFDPTVNVKLGTAYLRELADRYGDVSIALAAYNWGPGRIDRRLRRGATVPSRYIEQVMRAYDRNTSQASRRS